MMQISMLHGSLLESWNRRKLIKMAFTYGYSLWCTSLLLAEDDKQAVFSSLGIWEKYFQNKRDGNYTFHLPYYCCSAPCFSVQEASSTQQHDQQVPSSSEHIPKPNTIALFICTRQGRLNMNCPHRLSAFAAVVFMKYGGLCCLPSFGHMRSCCSVQPPGLLGNLVCHICEAVERNTVNIMLPRNLFLKLSHESSIC